EVELVVVPGETATAQVRTEWRLLVGTSITVAIAKPNDAECGLNVSRSVDGDEDVAGRRHDEVAGRGGRTIHGEIGDDERAEARREREARIVGGALDRLPIAISGRRGDWCCRGARCRS